MSESTARRPRTVAGMVGAMVVLLLAVLGFVAFRAAVREDLDNPAEPVDYAAAVDFYRAQARFPLLAPPSLPPGWRATSVRFDPTRPQQSWHLGVLTDEDDYVGLEQARESEPGMVDTYVDDQATRVQPVTIAGERWNAYRDAGGDYAVVRRERGVTTLVVGTLPESELVAFVESLRVG